MLESSKRTGRIITTVNEQFLGNDSQHLRSFRKHLLAKDLLEAVISLPTDKQISNSPQSFILILDWNKRSGKKDHILFINLNDPDNLKDIEIDEFFWRNLIAINKDWKLDLNSIDKNLLQIRHKEQILEPNYSIHPSRYSASDITDHISYNGSPVLLEDILSPLELNLPQNGQKEYQ